MSEQARDPDTSSFGALVRQLRLERGMTQEVLHGRSDLDRDTPPGVASSRHNLPARLTSFVEREGEMIKVRQRLHESRLVTITGSGGSGKTRLALELAREVLEDFPDGVWLIELAPVTDPSLVPATIAAVVGISEVPDRPLLATLADYLRNREVLLVVDNCEHVFDACARAIDTLLQACPGLRILATSRELLGVAGEATWRVPSLSIVESRPPATGEDIVQAVRTSEAGRLFIDRARLVAPAFEVTADNSAAVAQVCWRLDGIPLAIELAAARVRVLTVEQIAVRLDDRFHLLTAGSRLMPPRQRTLLATVDWSYSLLTDPERVLFRRLAVFAGGWTLDAAEAVGSGHGIDSSDVLDLLTGLVDKSLVLAEGHVGGERYRLLETIREYATAKLDEAGEAELARIRHCKWFISLAELAAPELEGPDRRWYDRLEAEHDNLRAALARCTEIPDGSELLLRLVAALGRFWENRGLLREGSQWLETALERSVTPRHARARALGWLGNFQRLDGNYEQARQILDEGVAIARTLDDRSLLSFVLRRCAFAAVIQGDRDEARQLMEEALAVSQAEGNKIEIASNLCYLGVILVDQAPPEAIESLLVEAVAVGRESGDVGQLCESLVALGRIYGLRSDFARARDVLAESLELAHRLGNLHGMPVALLLLSDLARAQRDLHGALDWGRQVLRLYPQLGRRVAAIALRRYAGVCAEAGQRTHAACLFGALETYGEQPDERLAIYRGLGFDDSSAVQAMMGDATLAAAWAGGRRLALEQAIERAMLVEDEAIASSLEPHPNSRRETPDAPAASVLSLREREVAILVAKGLSNRAIADALVIAPRTVETHVSNILGKLELHTRAQIAAWSVEQGMVAPLRS